MIAMLNIKNSKINIENINHIIHDFEFLDDESIYWFDDKKISFI